MLQNRKISLCGDWTLRFVENKRFKQEKRDISTFSALEASGWRNIAAKVPGNFELDFERAGIIGNPFYACNTIENERFENLHLIYSRKIALDFDPDENTFISFDGIDTIADIYVNGTLIGHADNMLVPFEFSGNALRRGENEIIVHITPACIAAREYEVPVSCAHHAAGFDSLFIRKAPHMYGWDIMPRAVSGGIWRDCRIVQKRPDRIDDLFVWTHTLAGDLSKGSFGFFWNVTIAEDEIRDYTLKLHGECGGSVFDSSARLWHTGGKRIVEINHPKLWFPKNYGEPNLYEITATLLYKGEPVYEYHTASGMRTVELERTSTTDADGSGEFCFRINYQKVFWQGTNWVPVDAYHSRDKERLPGILPMLNDLNCNCVRCWGGNVYEDDIFYDFCDRNGIMIWQDFTHACGINPQTEDYLARFGAEVEKIVKRLRNHASIILWAGDNEVDECYKWNSGYIKRDPNGNRLTREVIPNMLKAHDFTRPYIPSSPYIDEEAFKSGKPHSEAHLWGPRDYFKGDFYKNTVCHFASETGYHGCPSPETLKKFIRPEQLWHWKKRPETNDGIPKDDWCCHAACSALEGEDWGAFRIRLMSNQVKTLFPSFREHEEEYGLEKFARASQISQAEAKKYFIERFRATKWRRTGIIWWNLIDGWPQISDAVVDYYGTKKLAYHYIKRSQQQLCLMFGEPENGILPLIAASDLQKNAVVRYRVTDIATGKALVDTTCLAAANSSSQVWGKPMEDGEKRFYLITWEYELDGRTVTGKNHYVTNIIDLDYDEYMGWIIKAGFDEFEGFN